jgi:hypothetical protein
MMSKMKRTIAVMLAAGGLVLGAGTASALDSVYLIWRSSGTPTVGTPTVNTSSILLADVVMEADSAGISGIGVSFVFDPLELQAIGLAEISPLNAPGMGNGFAPLSPGPSLIDNVNGLIAGFDQADLTGAGLTGGAGALTLGSVRFHVVQATNGPGVIDVQPGFFTGSDGIVDSIGFEKQAPQFFGASVTGPVVPEPTTALLVVAGLAGLGYAGRRSLR